MNRVTIGRVKRIDHRAVRMDDVARAAGLSRTTVSLVLSGKSAGRISAKTEEAVRRAAAQHDCLLLRNHGTICLGKTFAEAVDRAAPVGALDAGGHDEAVGDELFVIARGTASVYRVDGERSMRLITFGEGTLFGPYVMRMQQEACGFWPRAVVDAAYSEPVQSSTLSTAPLFAAGRTHHLELEASSAVWLNRHHPMWTSLA